MLLSLSLQDRVKIFLALEKVFITIHVTTTNSNLFCWDSKMHLSKKHSIVAVPVFISIFPVEGKHPEIMFLHP